VTGVKHTIRIGERGQQRSGAWPAGPRHAAGMPYIEVVRDDPAVHGDQFASGLLLPGPYRRWCATSSGSVVAGGPPSS